MIQTSDFLSHLNPSQRRAVEHFCGPLLVVAGAGSGKTRALTYRIANLILTHKVEPDNILAVTFTNKAAREMKSRIEEIFAQRLAESKHAKRLDLLPEDVQTQLRSQVYRKYLKPLWIGTFHSLCTRILRYDINKYQDEQGRQWQRNFSIFDESDAQSLVKNIVTKKLNLDDQQFDPRKIRYAISNAKNQGLSPQAFAQEQTNYKGRTIAEVYSNYQEQLAANNSLDFDDLILVPVRLFQQNQSVLNYWHQQFHHILVDEYQDTNRIQYDLIRLLTTKGEPRKEQWDWTDRSVFVVGDADQCQPKGTQVLTTEGYIPIESLNPQKHLLISYDSHPAGELGKVEGYHFSKEVQNFHGKLIVIKAEDKISRSTSNHKWPVRWNQYAKDNIYIVYLMRRDNWYRVGWCKLFKSNGGFQLGYRVRLDKADGAWILAVTDNSTAASIKEAAIAARYGIPTVTFEPINNSTHYTKETLAELFDNLADVLPQHIYSCLEDYGLDPHYPSCTPEIAYQYGGGRGIMQLQAVNLISDLMEVGVDSGDGQVSWKTIKIDSENYHGFIYSLNVEQHHLYFADGLLTHNSIYSFRLADFTILLDFQEDFGDGLSDEDTQTMVKLEENYRSRENILQAANHLIEKNTQRIDKILRPTRGVGEKIYSYQADDELAEAEFVVSHIRRMKQSNPELDWGSFAILYRTNAQSRPLEDALRPDIPYIIVGGLKFYDRKEIKDALAYLRAIANPADTVSLLRIINTPRRGIGQATIDNLVVASQELNISLWEILCDETSVNTMAGRSAKSVNKFAKLMQKWQGEVENFSAAGILRGIMDESGYIEDLQKQGTEEAENRLENISELYNAVQEFAEENNDTTLQSFLGNASLASDLDNLEEGQKAVSLMTLHSAKGLEFPVVFLVGLEQGLFPHTRSINDPVALEEERRLCYVGITRAEEQLFLSHARERRLYGYREPAIRSQFLDELPRELISSKNPAQVKKIKVENFAEHLPAQGKRKKTDSLEWNKGDILIHDTFGTGEVTHVFKSGSKVSIAVSFANLGTKILDPKQTNLRRVK
ncbi:MAG TPA: DNA helicase UvrD [Cyanobacteria bacterium UBA11149]|nr:DNA helicase UvrD [Cyanobacteria bacterium UBA11367]HBE60596.1 DNA helicase UvrD [Cyanobacteria bacterium UBA11366]HBK65846.1 DNA helicase UvrD [Cyanobacteria bacterium UBA11166]HBR72735.1 DNA helicase UvrD [Cyanobacteria bacterium UBA11159]HBS68850.1 DNA helicase UvrD [Cyanobacteria bacterium UBA11153]HBW92301.1 DNA helicase UvrD [Cyanobacteria bacterium UBA11149]HCA94593.1 DNA helicase UvrD [Cyanobacteria bacterium UBA9226]